MKITSPPALLSRIHRHKLLRPLQYLELVEKICPTKSNVEEIISELVARGWITPFQAERLVDTSFAVSVDQYLLVERLGGGGGSQVFKARDKQTGQIVALKVLHEAAMEQEETLVRFRREILAAMGMDHPNIVKAINGHLDSSFGYLVMEYVPGIDLLRVVTEAGRLAIPAACTYIRQAALGLDHIHRHGLIHRDIKPGNLLVTRDEPDATLQAADVAASSKGYVLKLLDLGLVRTHHFTQDGMGLSITGANSLLGTPDYMAPEQARDAKHVDIRADVYALGCTLHHLLTGEVPFPARVVMQKLYAHQALTAPLVSILRPEVPSEVAELIRRMMAKSPDERPQSPDEVARELELFSES